MSQTKTASRAKRSKTPPPAEVPPTKLRRADQMIAMMRAEGGATAHDLAAAVGWQVHSVRGFIAGTLKKRSDLVVATERVDGVTRYRITDAPELSA